VRLFGGRQPLQPSKNAGLKLFIVHYHFRPGGVRRVIELAAPHLLRALGDGYRSIVLIGGEPLEARWLRAFRRRLSPVKVEVFTDAALGYADSPGGPRSGAPVRSALISAMQTDGIAWAHNLALGRNLFLAQELSRICAEQSRRLIAHHHDWWCDNRWARWTEIRRGGFPTLRAVAAAIFPASSTVTHVAINQCDARILQRHLPGRAHWLPNLVERTTGSPPVFRRGDTGDTGGPAVVRQSTPIWLMPCRVLRRKNIAEALLLTRWLRPEAQLVVTGGADEMDELSYAATLEKAARKHHWPLRLGVLAAKSGRPASIESLLTSAEAVIFTSIQEGFGLPQLEAAAAGQPLIARRVPLVAPDLATFGFRFAQAYDELLVAPELFDWVAEVRRQARLFRQWRSYLPQAIRRLAETPILLAQRNTPQPVPVSRLTLTAQLEVLRQPVGESWQRCAPLNPFLPEWRDRAADGRLQATRWPASADRWLSGVAYGQRLAEIARSKLRKELDSAFGRAAQDEFISTRLAATQLFPLLFARET
jgi:glycosyltransferase involved in cell wall biosynthesis